MKNIFKYLFVALTMSFLFISCDDSADRDWDTLEPSFKLHDTTLGSNVLYASMKDNPFVLTWDENTNAKGDYSVVVSSIDDFSKKIELGKSSTNTFKTTIGALNSAVLQSGLSPYVPVRIYIRVENGTDVSNTISFMVTAYPSDSPILTAPTAGEDIVLNGNLPNDIAKTITWTDYNTYGVDVTYLIEVSKSGDNNFVTLESVVNAKSLNVSNKVFNDAVLKAGLQANLEGAVDIRVTATTKSIGGTINKVSNIVTFKVTPYVAFKNMYLVGDATSAGWSPDNNNQAIFRDPSNVNKFYFTGKFVLGVYNTYQFKLIENLGSWTPQWGLKSGSVANNDGGDPDPFAVTSAGYYTFTIDTLAKTYSLTPFTDSMTNYSTIGLIGGFNSWGGDLALSQSSFDSHQWSLKGVTFPAGEVKFRAEGSWSVSWGPTSALQSVSTLSGVGVKQNGQNINLEAGTYDVYFNDIDGRYQFIKK